MLSVKRRIKSFVCSVFAVIIIVKSVLLRQIDIPLKKEMKPPADSVDSNR